MIVRKIRELIIKKRKPQIKVRKTRGYQKQDGLHDYNIYIPYEKNGKKHYANIYTCMCCTDTFIKFNAKVSERNTGLKIKDVPLHLLEHWLKGIKHYKQFELYKLIKTTLETLIKNKRKELCIEL